MLIRSVMDRVAKCRVQAGQSQPDIHATLARIPSLADTGFMAAAVCFCSPEVPELQQMSNELARSKDFSGFVRRLRAAFVASLS